jgi:hypothetical protein
LSRCTSRSSQRKTSSQAGATTQAGQDRREQYFSKLIYVYFQQNQSKARKEKYFKSTKRVPLHRLRRQRTCALKRKKEWYQAAKKNEPSDKRTSKTEMEGKRSEMGINEMEWNEGDDMSGLAERNEM